MPSVDHHVSGRQHWLSLEQYADSAEFGERVAREFPHYDPAEMLAMPRRRFLQLMGASMALAGLTVTGCRRFPVQKLAPFAHRDPNRIPGATERYATFMELRGVATGLLVSSYDGRPIKIEGNPLHPYSLGASDVFEQASVLEMYDPDRSRQVLRREGSMMGPSSWAEFDAVASEHFAALAGRGGEGLAVLSESTSSPTLARLKTLFSKRLPQARWFEYEPISRDGEIEGLRRAFGKAMRPIYRLDEAQCIALFDADLLGFHPARLKHARDWALGRRTADEGRMSRVYMVESAFSTTGSIADHRYAARPIVVEQMLAALAAELGNPNSIAMAELDERARRLIKGMAADLKRAGAAGLVAVGPRVAPSVHTLAQQINHRLGAIGRTVSFVSEPDGDRMSHVEAIRSLTESMSGGGVETLVVLGGNAAYDAPGDADFAEALSRVPTSIHLSLYANETSRRCTWHLPRAHYLESWSDGRAWDGTLSIGQPLMMPLFDGRTPAETLARLCGEAETDGHALVRRTFAEFPPASEFEGAWATALHDGVVADSAWKMETPAPQSSDFPIVAEVSSGNAIAAEKFDIAFRPDARVYDGRFANSGWLQESPDPLSKVTWDNPALIGLADARRLGVDTGDVIAITAGGKTLEIAVAVLPGQPEGVIGMTLGGGRTASGSVGNGVGFNTYTLRSAYRGPAATEATVTRTGRSHRLAITHDHHAIDPVGAAALEKRIGKVGESGLIIREASLADYRHEPNFVHRDVHGNISLQLFEPPSQFNDPHAWGMAVDLNTCIGCNACLVACQAENNVPVVGKDQVINGREMHWLRIDRYFKGEPEGDVEVVHQPMMCNHCENAPCEQVCPVAATTHDSEGLNVMVYNRCIGTRYCSNNCPYKVRRFNYVDYHSQDPRGTPLPWLGIPDEQQKHQVDELRKMAFNPDVSVRMRGVMEKCTYCTQRIAAVKIARRTAGEDVHDGDILTACQQACPTRAIVFGNLNDPQSAVAKLQANNRAYGVLAELNTRPRTKYLARIRNPLEEGAPA